MRHLLMPVLSALLLATLPGCESAHSGAAPDVAPGVASDAPRRCMYCGWIESKRAIGPSAENPHAPAGYEYTVRMSDGSGSVFREAQPSSWREGERLILIKGLVD